MKHWSDIKQISTKMSASVEAEKSNKDDEETNEGVGNMQTPTPNQGEEVKETNTGNINWIQRHSRMELFQLHTAHRYFKGDTPEVCNVLG